MSQQMRKLLGVLSILLILSTSITPVVGYASQPGLALQTPNPVTPAQPEASQTIYLPLTRKSKNTPLLVASEMDSGADKNSTNKAATANVRWARTTVISWKDIQPNDPYQTNPPTYTYNWNAVDEANIKGLAASGIQAIAIVKYAPRWASKYPGYSCGPIAQKNLTDFANFMKAVVQRYSQYPYNVHYWELGNEPDVDWRWFPDDAQGNPNIFGCWGEDSDPYYGGGYYANMLKHVYPAIKATDPSAQVIIGGLLLDCDPTNPPPGKDCKPAKFLEGILVNGGANYFDIVSYHGYSGYNGGLLIDETYPTWSARGGLSIGKANFLREVMSKYGVNKPLFHSEGALICPETAYYVPWCNPTGNGPTAAFYEAQADYVVWLFVRDWANGMWVTSWYQFEGPGWRYSGLLDGSQNPKPVYYALQFLTKELSAVTYKQQISQYPDVRAYEFANAAKRIWVMWSPDDQNHTIDLPAGTIQVLDKYGIVVTPVSNKITVKSPVYVELTP
jgi:hypothetical protein